MKPIARLALALILSIAAQPIAPAVRAQEATADAARMSLPPAERNPYAQKLSAALMAYRVAYNRLYKDYSAYPWDHARLYRNYNAAWNAYQSYVQVRRLHDQWEQQRQGRFHGDVVTHLSYRREFMPLSERPSADAETSMARPDFLPTQPVAGATVRVVRDIYYFARPASNVTEGNSGGASIVAPQHEWSMTAHTDAKGRFEVRPLSPGRYRYTVEKAGFEPAYGNFEVGQGIASATRITLESRRQLAGRIWTVAPIALPLVEHILSRKIMMSTVSNEISEEVRQVLVSQGSSIPGQRPLLIPVSGAQVNLTPSYMLMGARAADGAAEPATAAAPTTDDIASADPAVARCIAYPVLSATTDASGNYSFDSLDGGSYSLSVVHPGHHLFTTQITLDSGKNVRDIILLPSMWERAQPMAEAAGIEGTSAASANGTVDNPFGAE